MIVALYAGLLGLIYLFLSAFVIKSRFRYQVGLGDDNNEKLLTRIRIHANFIEYVPLALFLIFLCEWEGAKDWFIQIMGIFLVVGRILHPIGLLKSSRSSLPRAVGMILTFTVLLLTSLFCIYAYIGGFIGY